MPDALMVLRTCRTVVDVEDCLARYEAHFADRRRKMDALKGMVLNQRQAWAETADVGQPDQEIEEHNRLWGLAVHG